MQLELKEVEIRGGNGENHCFSYQIRNWNLEIRQHREASIQVFIRKTQRSELKMFNVSNHHVH